MSTPLQSALVALQSADELQPASLQGLSDLDSAAAELAREMWADLPLGRRREAMNLSGTLAREHIELNFDRLALIGLQDSDAQVRRQAVANLWESELPSLQDRLLKLLLTDPDLGVRAEAAQALGRFVLAGEESEAEPAKRRALEEALLQTACATDDDLRLASVESLGFSSRDEVIGIIRAAYDAPSERSKASALLAMGRSSERRWSDIVLTELRSPSPVLRQEAARAAGELELRASVPELVELLEDVHPGVQQQAIWGLGQIGGKTAERALRRAERAAGDEATRTAIEEALEHLGFVESTRDLEAALRAWRESE